MSNLKKVEEVEKVESTTPTKSTVGKKLIDAELHEKLRNFAVKTATVMMESISIVATKSIEGAEAHAKGDVDALTESTMAVYYQLGRVMAYAEIAKDLLGLDAVIPPMPPQIADMVAKFK